MPTRKIERAEWQRYMDRISRNLAAASVDVRVEGLDIGDQIEVEHMPLLGLAYDPHSNAVEIAGQDMDHLISDPQEIWVEEEADGLHSLQVVDGSGHRQIVQLTRKLSLPIG